MDQGPFGARPVLRAADPDDRHHVPADAHEPGAARPGAGEGDAVHAGGVLDHVPVLPVGTGAVLAGEQPSADRAAVAREPDARARSRARRDGRAACAARREASCRGLLASSRGGRRGRRSAPRRRPGRAGRGAGGA